MISAMCELLLPRLRFSPHSREARRLVQGEGEDDDELALASARRNCWPGLRVCAHHRTHENTPAIVNTLYGPEGVVRSTAGRLPGSYTDRVARLPPRSRRRSPTARTARGGARSPEYTWQTLNAGFRPGMGQYIPDRFFWAREMDESGTGKA